MCKEGMGTPSTHFTRVRFTVDFFVMSYELRVGLVVGSWWWGWLFLGVLTIPMHLSINEFNII